MQLPVFLALFFAPVYVPLALLSGWLEAVASVSPVTHLLEAGRSLIAGSPTDVGLAFLIASGLAVALGFWALRGLRSAERAGLKTLEKNSSRAAFRSAASPACRIRATRTTCRRPARRNVRPPCSQLRVIFRRERCGQRLRILRPFRYTWAL